MQLNAESRAGNATMDVLQSALRVEDSTLLVVSNNTNELIIYSMPDLVELRSYAGLGSPRYAANINDSQVLVSDLYGGGLLVLNWKTGQRRVLPFAGQAAQMAQTQNGILITAPSSQYLYLYDSDLGAVSDSVLIGDRFSAISPVGADKGNMYVAAAGIVDSRDSGQIVAIDWPQRSVNSLKTLAVEASSLYPRVCSAADVIYVLQRDLHILLPDGDRYTQTTRATQLAQPYGLGVDPGTGEVYLGDANRLFSGPGQVFRYTEALEPLDTFSVGALPGGFVF